MARQEAHFEHPGFSEPTVVQLPREFFDLLPMVTGAEAKVLAVVLRYTVGCLRASATLSLSLLTRSTGLSINGVKQALTSLIEAGAIEQVSSGSPGAAGAVYAVRLREGIDQRRAASPAEESGALASQGLGAHISLIDKGAQGV
jgi:hypothetical protein